MNENEILLGKRQFLFSKGQMTGVGGWSFTLPPSFTMIAGGSANPVHTLISLYRESEKVAQFMLTHRKLESQLTVQAVASDLLLEVSAATYSVIVTEKS